MAGLVPAIHVFLGNGVFAWMPGTGPGHDVVGWGSQDDAATGRPDRGLAHRHAPSTSWPASCRPSTSSSATACSRECPGRGGHDAVGWGCQEDAATGRPDRGLAHRHAPARHGRPCAGHPRLPRQQRVRVDARDGAPGM